MPTLEGESSSSSAASVPTQLSSSSPLVGPIDKGPPYCSEMSCLGSNLKIWWPAPVAEA